MSAPFIGIAKIDCLFFIPVKDLFGYIVIRGIDSEFVLKSIPIQRESLLIQTSPKGSWELLSRLPARSISIVGGMGKRGLSIVVCREVVFVIHDMGASQVSLRR